LAALVLVLALLCRLHLAPALDDGRADAGLSHGRGRQLRVDEFFHGVGALRPAAVGLLARASRLHDGAVALGWTIDARGVVITLGWPGGHVVHESVEVRCGRSAWPAGVAGLTAWGCRLL